MARQPFFINDFFLTSLSHLSSIPPSHISIFELPCLYLGGVAFIPRFELTTTLTALKVLLFIREASKLIITPIRLIFGCFRKV